MEIKDEYCKYENLRKYPQKPCERNQLPSIPIEKIPQTKLVTLTRYIQDYERMLPDTSYQFSQLMSAIQTLSKTISTTIRNAGVGQRHLLGQNNIRLRDNELNSLFLELSVKLLVKSNAICLLMVKGLRDVIKVDKCHAGTYIMAICVLDKELTSDAISSCGTLFSIFKRNDAIKELVKEEILEPGRNAMCTGYIVYGSGTMFVIALRETVKMFSLDPILGEYILVEDNWRIPEIGYIYSVNEGFSHAWDDRVVNYLNKLKDPTNQRPWIARYSGSLSADCHRILHQGGIYLYPTNNIFPAGKIGLICEAIPLAYIAQTAGGSASSGKDSILHIIPKFIDEQTPFYFGSKKHVDILKNKYLDKEEMGSDYENEEYDDGGKPSIVKF